MTKWEYKIDYASKWDAVATNLMILGGEGWELVSVVESRIQPPEPDMRDVGLKFIFKRPIR